jgi:quinol monooxygenase YgiN
MILAVGEINAQIPERGAVERVMLAAQSAAREQDGCESYTFAAVIGSPGQFFVLQRWRDQAALEAHFRSESFAAYQAAIAPLLVRDTEFDIYAVDQSIRPLAPPRFDQDE